jgi:hypothetical protein
MENCTVKVMERASLKRRTLEVNFGGLEVSSDGSLLLLRELDRCLRLTERVAAILDDPRDPNPITHPLLDLVRQRLYAMVHGYEDLIDHAQLRQETLLQSVLEHEDTLGSAPTLCRLENRVSNQRTWALHRELIETFIASFRIAPEELALNFDVTDDPVHGRQEGLFFHVYYDSYSARA